MHPNGKPASLKTRRFPCWHLVYWGVRGLLVVVCLIFFLAILFFCASRVLLPCLMPVSLQAWSQSSQVEVRAPFDATRLEQFVALNAEVMAGTEICCLYNDLPGRLELRDITQTTKQLQAKLDHTRTQCRATEQQLDQITAEATLFMQLTAQAIDAGRDRITSDLKATQAELENAQHKAERIERLGTVVTAEEQEDATTQVRVLVARLDSLKAELRRTGIELHAARKGVLLRDNVELMSRKARLEMRRCELRSTERQTEEELTAARNRFAAADREMNSKCRIALCAPRDGRVSWIQVSSGVIRANEPIVRISQPVAEVEALFPRQEAYRIVPGQRATISLSTGEYVRGQIERLDESSPASAPPSRSIQIPREPDQVRVLIAVHSRNPLRSAGVPATVALGDIWQCRFLLSAQLARWALVGMGVFAAAILGLKAVHAHLRAWRPKPRINGVATRTTDSVLTRGQTHVCQ